MKSRLKEKYVKEIIPKLMKDLTLANIMEVPKIEKICLSQGIGSAVSDKKMVEQASLEMTKISGQKSIITKSKKDIANFKLRKGMPIGVKVTLRRNRMYEFLDRLISISMPGIRDFQGINPKGFDGRGNYTVGIKEQIIFPEIDYDKIDAIRGLDISITTSAVNDAESRALLEKFNLPLKA